jgi:biotin transporter BioY
VRKNPAGQIQKSMKNLLSVVSILSASIWGIGYFHYHTAGFIHIFLFAAVLAAFVRIVQEVYYMKRRQSKLALVKAK